MVKFIVTSNRSTKLRHVFYRIICRVFGHRYEVAIVITPQIRELRCKRCGEMFGMNDDVKALLTLDKELIDAHNVLLHGI